ncbi:MAG: hypothetical protein WDN30_13090 [Pararobbsia sp.]
MCPIWARSACPTACGPTPCREEQGLIFVFPGDPAKATDAAFPTLGSVADPQYKTRRFGREVACHYSFMHENLMDMNHQFLHRARWARCVRARSAAARRRLGRSRLHIRARSWQAADRRGAGLRRAARGEFGAGEGCHDDPDAISVSASADRQRRRHARDGTLDLLYPARQGAAHESHLRPALDPQAGLADPARSRVPALVWFTERIFKEDRDIVEREQEAHDRQGADWNHEVFPVINELRALLIERGAPRYG